jgi:hypothetical protein
LTHDRTNIPRQGENLVGHRRCGGGGGAQSVPWSRAPAMADERLGHEGDLVARATMVIALTSVAVWGRAIATATKRILAVTRC